MRGNDQPLPRLGIKLRQRKQRSKSWHKPATNIHTTTSHKAHKMSLYLGLYHNHTANILKRCRGLPCGVLLQSSDCGTGLLLARTKVHHCTKCYSGFSISGNMARCVENCSRKVRTGKHHCRATGAKGRQYQNVSDRTRCERE